MAKKKADRMVVTMQSTESSHRYTTEKNRKNDPGRLELKKFCPRCRTHQLHRETR
ncbi:MAG: 50S ribosomal protein L33 [Thermomicrobiales bacterium]|nr:50S ribosomal protein L33 [Thermomicrobiales bacterium]